VEGLVREGALVPEAHGGAVLGEEQLAQEALVGLRALLEAVLVNAYPVSLPPRAGQGRSFYIYVVSRNGVASLGSRRTLKDSAVVATCVGRHGVGRDNGSSGRRTSSSSNVRSNSRVKNVFPS
jgi:hypothetical protein